MGPRNGFKSQISLDRLLNLVEPQPLHLYNGNYNHTYPMKLLRGLKIFIYICIIEWCKIHSKYLININYIYYSCPQILKQSCPN